MPLEEPSWWYRRNIGWRAPVLTPLAKIYGAVAGHRMTAAARFQSRCPVICVGNLTAGGTGKTPFSILLANLVDGLGRQPVFLTRGHGGRIAGPIDVDLATQDAADVGDETLLLARMAPTVVARRRDLGAAHIESRHGANAVVIMDDGLQNPSLHKDFSFAVIDAARGIGNGCVIPAGPLRAPLATQLSVIDAVVLNSGARGGERRSGLPDYLNAFAARRPIITVEVAPVGDVGWLLGHCVIAFAGIGHPERFFELLRLNGAEIVEARAFRDHEPIGADAAADLLRLAEKSGATLVTTAKDMARLKGATGAAAELAARARVVDIEHRCGQDDTGVLQDILRGVFETKRSELESSDPAQP